ncbi:MAG TPA: putative Ig domain-containing protein [Chthoniobacterales bacterium]
MKLDPLISRLALVLTVFAVIPTVVRADVYDHSGTNGTLTDGMWFDQTTGMHGGNPGPGDDAYFYAATISASGGSVHLLSGGTLSLTGMLTAVDAGSMTLSGSGTLNLQAVVTDANGFGPILLVDAAHLVAQNGDGVADVTSGGTVTDVTCSGTNGCGFYSGKSTLAITGLGGPDHAVFSGASKLTANAGLTGFTLQLLSASTATVSAITNSQATVDGAGSLLTVAGDFSLNTQSMTISNGGVAVVNGNLSQVAGAPLSIMGSGSSLTVGKDLSQNTTSDTDISITTGASVTVQGDLPQARGQVTVDGAKSALTVDQDFPVAAGFVDLSAGATLTVNGSLVLDGGTTVDGFPISGGGTWDGAGTTITSQVMFVGNKSSAGFSLGMSGKAAVKSGNVTIGAAAGSIGSVNMSDIGTIWEVQSSGMTIGQSGSGSFTMQSGAHLTFDSGTAFAVGLSSGSHGTLTCDTASVDATAAPVSIGEDAGSSGSVNLTDSDFIVGNTALIVGDSGSGSFLFNGSSAFSVTGANTTFLIGNETGSSGSVSGNGSLMAEGPTTVGVSGSGYLSSDGGVLSLTNTAGLTVGSKKGGTGTVVLGPSSSLTLAGPLLVGDAGTGSIELDSNSQLTLPSANEVNLVLGSQKGGVGTMTVTALGSFSDAEPILIGKGGHGIFDANLNATLNIFGFSAPYASGGQATITVDGSTWTNTGNIYLGSLSASNPPSTLAVTGGSTMRVNNQMTIFQSGTATVDGDSMMAVGTGDFGPGGTLRVSTGGILSGYGQVQAQVIVAEGGQIFPGNSPGIFNITGDYQQLAGSTYSAEIGGTTAGTDFDQINATGAATLGGTLKVRLVKGFTPTVGQKFQVVKAASTNGSFAVISQPSQAGISVTSDATGTTVTVTSVVAGAPVISSATSVGAAPGVPFSYQITATNNPTSYGATNLPSGLKVNNTTGLISGTPAASGAFAAQINANNAAGSGQADLIITIDPVFGVIPAPPSNLLNISTRLNVQTGDNVLIGGFILVGSDPKEVLIRGIGPSLTTFGVEGALANPVLELHKPDGTIVTNDDWKSTQQADIAATGLAPTNDLESAILVTLDPGAYTAILTGKSSGTGVGLVEAYDLDQASASTLANISTRGLVETGDDVMIGGFIVGGGGGGASTVVVRAIGPSLTSFGVANALQNPMLELHDSSGALVAANDDWMDGPDHQTISDDGLAPTDAKESALLGTLAPGAYTAIVSGVGGTSGIGLVESYNLLP